MRCTGIRSTKSATMNGGIVTTMSVSIRPGVMQLTVTPIPFSSLPAMRSANAASRASVFVSPKSPAFDGRVVRLADVAHLGRDRRDVDDPPGASRDHVLDRRLGHVEGAREVHLQHLVPVGRRHLRNGLVDRDARVVDEDVEPAVLLDHLLDDALAVLRVADVALMQRQRRLPRPRPPGAARRRAPDLRNSRPRRRRRPQRARGRSPRRSRGCRR